MIRDPAGILYATRGADGGFHATGTFHDWPIRISLHRATDRDGNPAVSIRIYDGDEASDARHALGPSVLIDGFGTRTRRLRCRKNGGVDDRLFHLRRPGIRAHSAALRDARRAAVARPSRWRR